MMGEETCDDGDNHSFACHYHGHIAIDKRYNFTVVTPWLLAEVRRASQSRPARLELAGRQLSGREAASDTPLFSHRLLHIRRFIKSKAFRGLVAYIYDPDGGTGLEMHAFMMDDVTQIDALYQSVQAAAVRHSGDSLDAGEGGGEAEATLGKLDTVLNRGHQIHELLYLGRVRLRGRSLDNFDDVIQEVYACLHAGVRLHRDSAGSGASADQRPGTPPTPSAAAAAAAAADGDQPQAEEAAPNETRRRRVSSSSWSVGAGSAEEARTAMLVISPTSLRLYSSQRQQLLWERPIRDVVSILSSYRLPDHIGLIAESEPESPLAKGDVFRYALFIFQCASKDLAASTFATLKQTFLSCQDARRLCDLCPINRLNRLCEQVAGLEPEEVNSAMAEHVIGMDPKDTDTVEQWLRSCDAETLEAKNEMLMALLRQLCSVKQAGHEHVRPADEARTEEEEKEDLLSRAKKSFFSSLKSLSQKKTSGGGEARPRSVTTGGLENFAVAEGGENYRNPPDVMSPLPAPIEDPKFNFDGVQMRNMRREGGRPRSSTLEGLHSQSMPRGFDRQTSCNPSLEDSFPEVEERPLGARRRSNSGNLSEPEWQRGRRQSMRVKIFTSVVSAPRRPDTGALQEDEEDEEPVGLGASAVRLSRLRKLQRSRERYRALWRKAIAEIRMLIRMEKQNAAAARARGGDSATARLLAGLQSYEDLSNPPSSAAAELWRQLLALVDSGKAPDPQDLMAAVRSGVPRGRRADAWRLLVRQHRAVHGTPPGAPDASAPPYEELTKQLTVHQHAIIIDVGRTFPGHPLFSDPEKGGQLSLFNILKAYSLLDKEIGYCQGISFIVGVLLIHMPESEAFEALKFLMFDLDYRRLFTPDMSYFQVCLYQMSRLIHDHLPDLHQHFEYYAVSTSYYVTPWFLSLFATQYVLGFVARAFDLVFAFGVEAIFRIGFVLLSENASQLMECRTFESICDYLRSVLPAMSSMHVQKVFDIAFRTEISDDLKTYAIEYRVLNEEVMANERSGHDFSRRLQDLNRELARQKRDLSTRYEVAERVVTSQRAELSGVRRELSRTQNSVRLAERENQHLRELVAQLRDILLDTCPDPGDALGEKLAIEVAAALS